MSILSKKALTVIWSAVLQWARVGMNAVVFLVLSRWLTLSEIGVVAAVQAPVIILQALVTTMFPDFIVQERMLTQRRLSTVFWLSVATGAAVSILLLLASPLIVAGLDDDSALAYMLVLAFCPLAWAMASVFEGLHRRALNTRTLAVRTAFSSIMAGVISIFAGYHGWGGWAIVLFTLVSTLISAFLTFHTSDWRPTLEFSARYWQGRRSRIFALGGRHLLGAGAIPTIQYAVAYQLGLAEAGIFQVAVRLYTLVDSIVMSPYRFVVMPLFSSVRKDGQALVEQVAKAVSLGSMVAAPAYICLIIIAPALIPLMLGDENGLPCVLAVQFLALNGLMATPTNIINQILVARGHAVAAFRRSILMYLLAIFPSVLATSYSVYAVSLVYGAVGGLLGTLVTLAFANYYLGIGMRVIVGAWLRLMAAAASLLILYAVYLLMPDGGYVVQVGLILVLAPLLYVLVLVFLARSDVKVLIDVLKRRRQ